MYWNCKKVFIELLYVTWTAVFTDVQSFSNAFSQKSRFNSISHSIVIIVGHSFLQKCYYHHCKLHYT
jgi:hypothetical protein